MVEADCAFRAIGIAPVGHACDCGAHRSDDPHDDEPFRASRGPLILRRSGEPEHVEEAREQPRPNRHIGNCWMQGMTQPCSVQERLEPAWRLAIRANDDFDALLEGVAQAIGDALLWRRLRIRDGCLYLLFRVGTHARRSFATSDDYLAN